MSPRAASLLWAAQRASAVVLALLVTVHLGTVIWAVQGGLSAGEILSRTRGSAGWLAFYLLFVLAVTVHVPIGLRNVLAEHLGWRSRGLTLAVAAVAAVLLVMGVRAAWGVFA